MNCLTHRWLVRSCLLTLLFVGTAAPRAGHAQDPPSPVYLPLILRSDPPEAHPPPVDRGTWTAYTDGDDVNDLAVDPTTGDVWAATQGGAVKWDPRTGTYMLYTMQDGLAATRVDRVTADMAGNRWFLHQGDDPDLTPSDPRQPAISRLDPDGEWETVAVPEHVPAYRGVSLAAQADGTLWLGDKAGAVYRRDPDGTWDSILGAGCGWIFSIAIDRTGAPWFGSQCGLRRMVSDGEWRTWLDGQEVQGMALVNGGPEIWFGSGTMAYHLLFDGRVEQVDVADRLPGAHLVQFAVGADGAVWFGASAGVARRDPDGTWRRWIDSGELPTKPLHRLVVDGSGNAWLTGGSGPGVHQLTRDGAIRHLRTAVGPSGPAFWAVLVDRAGNRWFGSNSGGLSRLTADGRWETASMLTDQARHPASKLILDIAEDGAGNLWLGTALGLGRRTADGRWRTYDRADGLPDTFVKAVLPDPDGSVWFGTRAGVGRLMPDDSVRIVDLPGAVTSSLVMAIRRDALGNLWFAMNDDARGLVRLAENGSWRTFTQADGLPGSVTDVAPDDAGGAWLAIRREGLAHVTANGRIRFWRAEDGALASNLLGSVVRTPDGGLWVGAQDGVSFRAPGNKWTVFRRSPAAWFGTLTDIAVEPGGDLWFTDSEGAVWNYRPGGPGATCAAATAFAPGDNLNSNLQDADDRDFYRIEVRRPFSRIEITVTDPDNRLDVALVRSCNAIGAGRHIGSGRHIGAGRHIGGEQRLVFDATSRTGSYFLVVRPRPGDHHYPLAYRVRLGLSEADTAETRTLILTHEPAVLAEVGLDYDAPEVVAWEAAVARLAEHPTVSGMVVWDILEDIDDPAVYAAYQDWQAARPAEQWKAEVLGEALGAWIRRLKRTELARLQYIVIMGDDRVVPHARVRIDPGFAARDDGWVREAGYARDGGVPAATTVGAALLADYSLGDDAYAAGPRVPWGGRELRLDLPELAVGRLVERPADMTAVIDAYLARDGVIRLDRALVAGYDFMADGPDWGDRYLAAAGLPEARRTRLVGDGWRAEALRDALLGGRSSLSFFAAHAAHDFLETPGNGTLRAREVLDAPAQLAGTLAYGLACHAGLNLPAAGRSESLDFPEAWQRRGATYIGSTGWAYGFDGELQYQEDLMAEFTRLVVEGGGMAVGDALAAAKRSYFWDVAALNHFHAKTIAGTVLYGLPMARVELADPDPSASGDLPLPPELPAPDAEAPVDREDGVLSQHMILRVPPDALDRVSDPAGDYFTFRGRPARAEGGEPVQPRVSVPVFEIETGGDSSVSGSAAEPRAVLWLGGRTRLIPNFHPLVRRAGVMGRLPADVPDAPSAPDFSAPGWFPTVPVALRTLPEAEGDGTLLFGRREGRLQFTVGQFDALTAALRLFDELAVDLYFSAAADREPPAIRAVRLDPNGSDRRIEVEAEDGAVGGSGVARVVATWLAADGAWRSAELAPSGGDLWSGQVAAGVPVLVQAVDGVGNVAVSDNDGALWGR